MPRNTISALLLHVHVGKMQLETGEYSNRPDRLWSHGKTRPKYLDNYGQGGNTHQKYHSVHQAARTFESAVRAVWIQSNLR